MPDPKLVALAEEFKTLLHKHDVAGIVMLSSPTHMEFILELATSWSGITVESVTSNTYGVRIRIRRADFQTDEEYKKAWTVMAGTICGFADNLEMQLDQLRGIQKLLGTKTEISHISRLEP